MFEHGPQVAPCSSTLARWPVHYLPLDTTMASRDTGTLPTLSSCFGVSYNIAAEQRRHVVKQSAAFATLFVT